MRRVDVTGMGEGTRSRNAAVQYHILEPDVSVCVASLVGDASCPRFLWISLLAKRGQADASLGQSLGCCEMRQARALPCRTMMGLIQLVPAGTTALRDHWPFYLSPRLGRSACQDRSQPPGDLPR